jgi:methylated-DNA-[protein]-cysteine S-methyltransferase
MTDPGKTRKKRKIPSFSTRPPLVAALFQAKFPAPFALLGIRTEGGRLAEIRYLPRGAPALAPLDALAERACRQIERYLEDPEFRFDLPLALRGTAFQRAVWRAIAGIASGRTASYGELARALGTGARAVGAACGANPLPLVVPCHRVVARSGLGGFMRSRHARALEIKRWLLRHEGAGCVP